MKLHNILSSKLLLIVPVVLLLSCLDDNSPSLLEAPDNFARSSLITSAGDSIETIIGESYRDFWMGHEHWIGGPLGTSTMADEVTSSWGNMGMQDLSSEPRVAYDNSATYNYRGVVEEPWFKIYAAISAVNDGLAAIDGGLQIRTAAETQRARAFAYFVRGVSYGFLGSYFDKALVSSDNNQLVSNLFNGTFATYSQVNAQALADLQQCITISNANTFTIGWINGPLIDQAQLAALAHSYSARLMASVARTPTERAAVNWFAVKAHAQAGITVDWGPVGDGYNLWYSDARWVAGNSGWTRADYKTIGFTDTSGNYAAWLATPVSSRVEMYIYPADRRITGIQADPESAGLYFRYAGVSPFSASRGTYHFSMYMTSKWDAYKLSEAEQMTTITAAEMDFLIAEAEYRIGNLSAAAALINNYGVTNGQLPAVSTTNAAEIWKWLKYNKQIETYFTGPGIAYFDDRGWGDLVSGTPLHFPVPAAQLRVAFTFPYTFGGIGGDGSAPKRIMSDGRFNGRK